MPHQDAIIDFVSNHSCFCGVGIFFSLVVFYFYFYFFDQIYKRKLELLSFEVSAVCVREKSRKYQIQHVWLYQKRIP